MIRVLFVCMGNICRSPTAEGVFRHVVEQAGLSMQIVTDSAGTSDYQKGNPVDRRAQLAAGKRGYNLSRLQARQVGPQDFHEFDHILAMDYKNLDHLKSIYPNGARAEVSLFLQYARNARMREVPDPYFGSVDGFELVLDLVEDAAHGFLQHLLERHRRTTSGR
ncbi:MAG: low molecular weight phosphotyrosine protein phosphatase [Pseudomonadota bacterium]|nr:low molecular weight phosphotyrosine protein phosphatase [Pseudomonadota bacterium]